MSKHPQLTGKRFGRLAVVSFAGSDGRRRQWKCLCDCGTEVIVSTDLLTRAVANKRSCGCLVREAMAKTGRANGTHNLSRTVEYQSWRAMHRRCYDPKNNRFKYYGGSGIRVCERWRSSFENFLLDMGKRPTAKHSIDRFPNAKGNYTPGNCRWATSSEQSLNRRPFRPHTTKLTPEQVSEIRRDKRSHAEVGRAYGVSGRQIGSIRRGEQWKNISQNTEGASRGPSEN